MRYLKLYESFGTQDKDIEKFVEILDHPRQNDDGFLEQEGEVSISEDIENSKAAKRGLEAIEKDPGLLNSPLVKGLFKEWNIVTIVIDRPYDTVYITYDWMTPDQWEAGNYDDSDYTYAEYLEEWGVDMDPMWVKIEWP
jgi:hypothetical protein